MDKPDCKYGNKCYRKNADHLEEFSHPGRDDKDNDSNGELSVVPPLKKRKSKESPKISDYFGDKKTSSNSGEEEDGPKNKKAKVDESEVKEPSKKADKESNSPVSSLDVDDEEDGCEDSVASPEDVKENIKSKFLMEMPEDFYLFWDFCKNIDATNPRDALMKTLNLRLVGPFDIIAGCHKTIKRSKKPNFLLHYRYFYDPPEFQTVIIAPGDQGMFHLGYYRDDPKEPPVFVGSNAPGKSPKDKIYPCGGNLFAAVRNYATKQVKFLSTAEKKEVASLIKSLEAAADKHDLSIEVTSKAMKARQKKVVCPTFHGAGIVVPVDDNDVGYRPVPESPADLRAMMKKIADPDMSEEEKEKHEEDLQELITLVQFANDEADYGEGLELGIDLFSQGSPVFHPHITMLLPLAYQLLHREEFSKIIEAHLAKRTALTESVDQLA